MINLSIKQRERLLIIFSVVASLLIVGALAIGFSGSRQNKNTQEVQPVRYDANSGETTDSTPTGPAEQKTSVPDPVFLGMSKLLDYGVNTRQMNSLSTIFRIYLLQAKKEVQQISINAKSITSEPRMPGSDYSALTFMVVFDQTSEYNARFLYYIDDSIQLQLINDKNEQMFDSGIIPYGTDFNPES